MVVKMRPVCVPELALESRIPARTRHHAERLVRHLRVLTLTTRIGAAVSLFFGIQGLIIGVEVWWIPLVNLASGAIFLLIPLLYRFGDLVAPLGFFFAAYASITVLCWNVGTGSGLQFYFLVAATLMVVILGIDHIVLPSGLAAFGAATVLWLEFNVPNDTGAQPEWSFTTSF